MSATRRVRYDHDPPPHLLLPQPIYGKARPKKTVRWRTTPDVTSLSSDDVTVAGGAVTVPRNVYHSYRAGTCDELLRDANRVDQVMTREDALDSVHSLRRPKTAPPPVRRDDFVNSRSITDYDWFGHLVGGAINPGFNTVGEMMRLHASPSFGRLLFVIS